MKAMTGTIMFCMFLIHFSLSGAVTLPAVVSDHMVLQRSGQVPVWGWCAPGTRVEVRFDGRTCETVSAKDGRFEVELDLSASGPGPFELVISDGGEPVTIRDVLVGEVFLCGGQSNMAFYLRHAELGRKAIRGSANARLRFFESDKAYADTPQRDVKGRWIVSAPEHAPNFSAVAYFFGSGLQAELNVPVGILHSSWGGTPIEAWMSREALAGLPAPNRLKRLEQKVLAFRQYRQELSRFEKRQKENPDPARKPPRRVKIEAKQLPSVLYNARIAPLAPYRLRGVVFYQGESNASTYAFYGEELRAFMADWRRAFRSASLPFLICQLPEYREKSPVPVDITEWAGLRASQFSACDGRTSFPVVLLGLGETGIHPPRKKEVGDRAAAVALKEIYRRSLPAYGPCADRVERIPGGIRIAFRHAEGLRSAPLKPFYRLRDGREVPVERHAPSGEIEGFAVKDARGQWHWCAAKIVDGGVVLSTPAEWGTIQALQYAWSDNPTANLVNAGGLPAAPFRRIFRK